MCPCTCEAKLLIFALYRERELNVTEMEANIQQLKPSTRYTVRMFAFNSYGFSETPASLTVQTDAEGTRSMLE